LVFSRVGLLDLEVTTMAGVLRQTACPARTALEVAFAAPEQLLLLASRSPLASLSRCLLVTEGDQSAAIVEGRFGRRSSGARFFTRPVGLWAVLWHRALLVAPYRRLGHWKNARAGTQAVEAASTLLSGRRARRRIRI
jgi:hypothetical protein